MKKAFWWILGILLSPILLFFILTLLLYFPPVQNWVVDKVAAIASEKTGMQITVDHVNLSFPLDLGVNGVHVLQLPSDTIADVERMVVDLQLRPLLRSEVVINQLEINNVKFNTLQMMDAAKVKGQFKCLSLSSKGIDLDKQIVELNGAHLEDAKVDIALNDSVPEDTTTSENHWKIYADSLTILRSDISFHMPGDTMSVNVHLGQLLAKGGDIDLEAQTYQVASLEWNNGSLQYDLNYEPQIEGLDYSHIDLSYVNIAIDSIYYPEARLIIRSTQLKEKSGLQVTDLTGAVTMKNGVISLPQFHLKTPDSDIAMELDMPLSLMEKIDPGKMRLRLNAQLGKQDLMRFLGGMPQTFQQRWPNYPLSIKGSVNGNLDYMDFDGLDVSLPTAFHITASGFAASLADSKRRRAKVQFKAKTDNLDFLTSMLPKNVQHNYRIPNGISAEGLVRADGAQYFADVVMREGRGLVKANGSFNMDIMRYDATMQISDLNVHHFMPHDSIYSISADIKAKGQGTDVFSPRTILQAEARIHHLGYGHYHLTNMSATADIQQGRAHAAIVGDNQLLNGIVSVDALMSNNKFDGTVAADMTQLDLYQLRLVDNPLTIGLCGHLDVSSDLNKTHYLSGIISDLTIRDSVKAYRPEDVGLMVNLRPDTTYARIQSGDFIVKLDASGDYEQLMGQLMTLSDSVMAQIDQKVIDQPALRRLLPTMKFHVESKKDNPIANVLKTGRNIDFKSLFFDMMTSPATGINGSGYLHSLVYDGTRLDTINFRLTQRKEHLTFGGQVRNNKRNPQFVFNALFDGVLQERGATMGVRYYDSANKLGVRIGAQAEMVDSGIHIRLVPGRPTIGYKEFSLNDDNFIYLGSDKKVRAKIDLIADDGTGAKIYSEENDSTALQDITFSLYKIDLGELTSVFPYYLPRMTGKLNGDYHVVQHETGRFSVVSDMEVHGMTYEQSPIGNISTELVYLQKEDDAHAVEVHLMKDNEEIGILDGTYFNEGEGTLDVKLQLIHFPLAIVNGFVPDQIVGLEGYGEGELTIKGSLKTPLVDGEIFLDSSYLVSNPYGMRLRFDDDPVRIVGSNLLFENFSLYAYNNNPLTVMGGINFSNLDRIMVDLRMRASNYQIIGAKENSNSIAYGKAFVDFFGRMDGVLDNLSMRGRLNVLGSTDMSYVLRDTPLSTDNQLEELVQFTDFSDTTQAVVKRPELAGFNMDLTMEVSKGAHIMAYLNADHSNYIDLMGGGTLRMRYTPMESLQLTGRYTLSNGEMKYSLPVIPMKTFTIQDGSYIEFTGEPMNPTLNITATERTKASVTSSDGGARNVEFDCGVLITRTLSDMGLEFTLDAPEDMQLHSELQAMGKEQRGKLAVSMLTTGMYLADGNTNSFTMNSALSSFLNSEINQITGNALRTLDLSFGMDNTTDASGAVHTDYSFKFAKRFWNNRLKIVVGGKVSSGADYQDQNNSFFDNVTFEYRLDNTANKYVTLFYQNNSYDWLDGYTQKFGGGFVWRRSVQSFSDLIRFRSGKMQMPLRTQRPQTSPKDSLNTKENEAK